MVCEFDLLANKHIDITRQHMDCGIEIYDSEKQHTDACGSGCGCNVVVL
ncbi:MAG: stage V sporulation protein AD, partial [Lachnospiraceae bacterium]|nr:stage V sporulation protein AD [Lachnospiraceae bacterium]